MTFLQLFKNLCFLHLQQLYHLFQLLYISIFLSNLFFSFFDFILLFLKEDLLNIKNFFFGTKFLFKTFICSPMFFKLLYFFLECLLFSLQLFNSIFYAFNMKFELMLDPNVLTYVSFKALHDFFINRQRTSDWSKMAFSLAGLNIVNFFIQVGWFISWIS